MTRNSSDGCWSSDTSSFGWVDMEDTEPSAAKKANTVEHSTSDSDDDSSDDTQFDPESESRPVLNPGREQKQNRKGNNPASTNILRGQVKNDVSEDSDSTQFEAEIDDRPAVKNTTRSKGNNPLAVKGNQLKAPGTNNASNRETSEDSTSSSESSDSSDKKDLKPFTKPLLVKKERHSHALSDDSDVDSPPLKTRLRAKSESETSPQRTKGNVNTTLIEGVLLDTAQPLPFDIGADEDLWIVQCPNEVSESTLKGKTLNFNGISSAEQFEGRVLLTANLKPVNLLLPKSPLKLTSVTPTGHIIFKDKEMVPHISHPVSNEDTITSLPAGLKQRHPLFGADLTLVQRLSSELQKRQKKSMKKKKKKQDVEPTFFEDENEIMESGNSAKFSNGLDTSSLHNKKKKKKIKHLDEQAVAFSQDLDIKNHNLQLSSFHSDSRPRMSSENNKNEFVGSDSFESEPHHKKHRKVKHESFSPEITNAYSELAYVTPSKKRKHKHLEYSFESDRQVTGGTSDETESMLLQKRKKRKYENDLYSTSERTFESSVSFAACSDQTSPKKKKHKYERGFQNESTESVNNKSDELAICSQEMTLDPVADELLHTIKKKKKKKIKENDTEFEVTSNIKTNSDINCISTKKKKKVKLDNSDEHSGQVFSEARDTKNSVHDFTGADLDYFEDSRKKLWKEERRKLQETEDLVEFSEEKFSSPITDVYQKKKKKRKSE